MRRLALIFVLVATPAFAGEANYSALEQMQEKANSYIKTLQEQCNTALDQIVALKAEIERLNKEHADKR